MLIVVAVNLGVALEAHWNSVLDAIVATLIGRKHVIGFNLDTAKSVADAAASVTPAE
jgi:hypothetical protein